MSRLLVLALAETKDSEDANGYEVIAWNINENKWVLIRKLSMEKFRKNGIVIWDIFSITEAKLCLDYTEKRAEVYNIDYSEEPKLVQKINQIEKKIEILEKLKINSIRNDIYNKKLNVGLVKPKEIIDLNFLKKNDNEDEKLFNWHSRITFSDQSEIWSWSPAGGVPCKDMRWKKYWHEIVLSQNQEHEGKIDKWKEYVNKYNTYFLIEIYPAMDSWSRAQGCFGDGVKKYFSIAGIHSIKL